ncbi:MAG: hypothetical protein JJ901_03600 [Erythrobacter sp.]|uniref:asparagine synthase-related protein n=1 Tax=Erythrobacter sp. TaxID=1042 RepID=UPI001B05564D|nr:asparagine synthetase B family protein [Erythrobacter sp.]MBO6767375.1 hypothetical protein [Erythrobacter sp.]
MKPLRFVLGYPREANPPDFPVKAPDPSKVCGSNPAFWHDSSEPFLTSSRQCIVVGALFSQDTWQRISGDDFPDCHETSIRFAKSFISRFWGGYVTLLSGSSRQDWVLLVDPSGYVPIYRIQTPTHVVFASSPDLLSIAIGKPLCLSYPAIAAHLLRPELRQRSTCLHGVEELPPGTIVRPSHGEAGTQTIWKAEDFTSPRAASSFEECATSLRALSCSVMSCWSEAFGKVSVAASGGVDSSLICAALAATQSPFDCITVTTLDSSGDERVYARDVATAFGVQCEEALYDPSRFDPFRSASAALPRPARRSFLNVLDAGLTGAMQPLGSSVVCDGNAGDNLFCFLHSSAPVVDRLRAEGLGSAAIATLLDMCRITGCSTPTMLRATMRRMMRRGPRAYWPADARFLVETSLSDEWQPLTSWLENGLPPNSGKRDHLALIMRAQNQIHGLTSGLLRFSPLASQPLVEFCLSVPTWVWASGGQNRALARAAFACDLPASVLARTSKAGPDSFIRNAFAKNRSRIAKRLIEGTLAANHVIDRAQVEDAMAVDEISDDTVIDRLLDLLEAENWARSWLVR